ncbi:MAG: hypothetical protein SGJ00_04445 [bacterium]|nr:hypothetical protein [bacterium]
MKKITFKKYLLFGSLFSLMMMGFYTAQAQVDKAIKYAWYFDYERAEEYLLNPENELNPDMVVQLAEALYAQGKYAQALYYYKIADGKDAIKTQQVRRNYVHSSTMMREKSPFHKKTNYFKSNYFLYTNIDTFAGNSANEDFAAFYWNNMLFVTTSRQTNSNEKAFQYVLTKMPFLDVYPFTEKGVRLPYPAYLPKSINTAVHDGPIAISKDTSLIVLSRNYSKANEAGVQNLYLSYFMRNGMGNWAKAKKMAFCNASHSYQHPFYNEAEKAVYFSSDMPGGKGGYDLYKTKWNGTQWTNPINLGDEINTEYDEVFPSFTPENELLYSTNHIETTGGLDIVLFSNGTRYLLNEPFNTIYDDFGVSFKSKNEGYFSSNRFSNKFDDNIYHFTLSEPIKQSLLTKAFDKETGTELDNIRINYSNLSGTFKSEIYTRAGRENVLIFDTMDTRVPMNFMATKEGFMPVMETNNEYNLKDGKLYKEFYLTIKPISAGDDQFIIEDNQQTTKLSGLFGNDQLRGNTIKPGEVTLILFSNPIGEKMSVYANDGQIKLDDGINPGTYTFDYVISNKANPLEADTATVTIIVRGYYNGKDLKTSTLNQYAYEAPVTDGLSIQNDTGYVTVNGDYVMNVRANDRYNGKKASFKNTAISNVESSHPGVTLNSKTGAININKNVPAGTYNVKYDLHPRLRKSETQSATAVVVVRNISQVPGRGIKGNAAASFTDNSVVYFNNDEPKTYQLYRPAYNYQNSFENYLKKMDEFYDRSIDSKVSLDTFFTSHVVAGYKDVNEVLYFIQRKLNQGVQVEVSVSAYCSPIASTAYNEKLSSRRLVAVTRFFKKWNDGALNDAIETNRINFWEHSVGELEAPKDVNEDYDKLNESVFGIKASRERRVTITVKIIN